MFCSRRLRRRPAPPNIICPNRRACAEQPERTAAQPLRLTCMHSYVRSRQIHHTRTTAAPSRACASNQSFKYIRGSRMGVCPLRLAIQNHSRVYSDSLAPSFYLSILSDAELQRHVHTSMGSFLFLLFLRFSRRAKRPPCLSQHSWRSWLAHSG